MLRKKLCWFIEPKKPHENGHNSSIANEHFKHNNMLYPKLETNLEFHLYKLFVYSCILKMASKQLAKKMIDLSAPVELATFVI